MNTDTPRTDSNAGYYCGYGIQRNPDIYIDPKGPFVSANFARELERENARLRKLFTEIAMQKLADEAQERGEYMVAYRAMRSLLLRIHSARIGMNEEAVIAALNDVDAFFREPNNN